MKKLLVVVALGAAAIGTQAFAQDQGGSGRMQRDQTRQEAQQRADMLFRMLDANGDGTVTKAEAEQALARFDAKRGGESDHRGNRMQRMIDDAFSGTESISLQQFEAQALARFDAQDLNHDGVVTAAERQQLRAERQAQKGQ